MDIGSLRHKVLLQNPGAPVPDGDGGYTPAGWANLEPALWNCSINPATVRDLERVAAGTVISSATHIFKGRFHPQVTTKTRITKGPRNVDGTLPTGSREFSVTGVQNLEERNIELWLTAVEVVA